MGIIVVYIFVEVKNHSLIGYKIELSPKYLYVCMCVCMSELNVYRSIMWNRLLLSVLTLIAFDLYFSGTVVRSIAGVLVTMSNPLAYLVCYARQVYSQNDHRFNRGYRTCRPRW